jgi:hypothetical protein
MGNVVAIVVGLAIAAVAQFLALMLNGAGHGWTEPFFYSVFLFVAYPVALSRIPREAGMGVNPDFFLLVLGVVATLLLFAQTSSEPEYFWRMAEQDGGVPVIIAWLLLWFGWQALTLANIVRTPRPPEAGGG